MPARICAVVTEDSVEAAARAIQDAATVADLIELRLDFLRDFDFGNTEALQGLLENRPLPTIITCRTPEEGGRRHVEHSIRLRLLIEGARRFADYCDIEAAHYREAAAFRPDPSRLIVSYHDFDKTPPNLSEVYERICTLPASIHKIVTRANTVFDALVVLQLLEKAQASGRIAIAMAMGGAGVITRILGPSRGSFLTYAALGPGRESAPGQPTCRELKDLYRIHRIGTTTAITGIIGNPIGHSASPAMHNAAFTEVGLDYVYVPFEVANLAEFISRFVRPETREIDWNLRGLSVTIPHKVSAADLADEIDETARSIGAVNTFVVKGNRILGSNTDADGAIQPLERLCALSGQRCGVIGAGGAARAVVHGLVGRGARVTLFARDVEKARGVARSLGVTVSPLADLSTSDVQILINATPAGMHGHSEGASPVPGDVLRGRSIAYDLVYNPVETRFLSDARARGCRTIDGLEMLVAQAGLQFKLWTGLEPPLDVMRSAAIEMLGDRPG